MSLTNLNYCAFCKFIISVRCAHYDYPPQVPRNLGFCIVQWPRIPIISYEHTSCVCRMNELVQVVAKLMQWKKMLVVSLFEIICPLTAMEGGKR
jgi:hypothetical protein